MEVIRVEKDVKKELFIKKYLEHKKNINEVIKDLLKEVKKWT